MNSTLNERHLEFMKECWRHGISDTLISTIVPVDHSQVSKIRRMYKIQSSARRVSKQIIYDLFEILKDKKFRYMISCSNPLRIKQNVEFWESHKDMFDYFMELRRKALEDDTLWEDIDLNETPIEEAFELEKESTVEHETVEDVKVSNIDESPVLREEIIFKKFTKEKIANDIKEELKEICHKAIEYELYDIARDTLGILEDDFDVYCQKS